MRRNLNARKVVDYQSALEYLYSLTDYEKERIARYDPDTLIFHGYSECSRAWGTRISVSHRSTSLAPKAKARWRRLAHRFYKRLA